MMSGRARELMTPALPPIHTLKGATGMADKTKGSTKRCTKCGEAKDPLTGFSKNCRTKDGRQSQCKNCNAAYLVKSRERIKEYRAKNRDHIKGYMASYRTERQEELAAYNAEYHAKNRKQISAQQLKYRTENPAKVRDRCRKYYTENRESRIAESAAYRKANPEKVTASLAKYRAENQAAIAKRGAVYYAANPEKVRAHTAVCTAVRNGQLVRPRICQRCGQEKPLDGHHYLGYAKEHQLDVQWLCRPCHSLVEKETHSS